MPVGGFSRPDRPPRPARAPGPSLWTGGAFGLSSTRRAALLALVVCALAVSVSVPLRNYLGQRGEFGELRARQAELSDQVAELERRKAQLSDPSYVEAQARERLRYVRPGEVPYVVQLPPTAPPPLAVPGPERPPAPWYDRLWTSVAEDGG